MEHAIARNVVGPQVRKARYHLKMTQAVLAARCNVLGWDISRGTLAKIEAQVRCVSDAELAVLARAIGCKLEALYPANFESVLDVVRTAES